MSGPFGRRAAVELIANSRPNVPDTVPKHPRQAHAQSSLSGRRAARWSWRYRSTWRGLTQPMRARNTRRRSTHATSNPIRAILRRPRLPVVWREPAARSATFAMREAERRERSAMPTETPSENTWAAGIRRTVPGSAGPWTPPNRLRPKLNRPKKRPSQLNPPRLASASRRATCRSATSSLRTARVCVAVVLRSVVEGVT